MSKTVTESDRAFWRNEINLWKTDRNGVSTFERWCKLRDLDISQMPRPLDTPPPPPKNANVQSSYDLKQERRRKRASNALKRIARKEKAKQKENERTERSQ